MNTEIENKVIEFIENHGGENIAAYTATTRVIQYNLKYQSKIYIALGEEDSTFLIEDEEVTIDFGPLDAQAIIDALVEHELVLE